MTDDAERKHVEHVQKLKTLIDAANAQWPMQQELNKMSARNVRNKYEALIAQKFTPAEALELCWRP